MKTRKNVLSVSGFILTIILFSSMPLSAQDYSYGFGDLEGLQDQNMEYVKDIQRIIDKYPDFAYSYQMEDGKVKSVTVTGVGETMDKERLEVMLFDLKSNKNKIKGKANRIGVFYSVDKEPRFKGGQEALQDQIISNLKYPEEAKDWGVQGTVYLKFVVDDKGDIPYATVSEDINTDMESYVEDLENQAVSALKTTDGEWIPGSVDGVKVPTLVVLPVTFDFEKDPALPALIR